jgi:hypothetical protein
MNSLEAIAIALVTAMVLWVYLKLKERIESLEHEVRWLRNELETLKPTEVRSAYDRNGQQSIARD